jgi:hypothetical protein
MFATVSFLGNVVSTAFHSDATAGLTWLAEQRLFWGRQATYRIESFDGFILHTL